MAVAAIDALAADLKIPKEKIQVDTIRAVDWSNSSIGCPKPGVAYLEVITPGHKVTLRADGQVYVVHEAKERAFVCHDTKAFAGIDPKMQFVFGKQMVAAQKDLAERLHVAAAGHQARCPREQQTWDDAGLGCPDPGVTYAPVEGHRMGDDAPSRDARLHVPHRPRAHDSLPGHPRRNSRSPMKKAARSCDRTALEAASVQSGYGPQSTRSQ